MKKNLLLLTFFVFVFLSAESVIAYEPLYKFEGRSVALETSANLETGNYKAIKYDTSSQTIKIHLTPNQEYFVPTNQLPQANIYDCSNNLIGTVYSNQSLSISSTNGYFCFKSDDYIFQLEFSVFGSPTVSYPRWIGQPDNLNKIITTNYPFSTQYFNVKDFGAKGNGTDDTSAIKNAVAYVASKQGGTLFFPPGDYYITDSIPLPSGIVVQGVASLYSDGRSAVDINGLFSRIRINGEEKAIFRLGLFSKDIKIRNIVLKDDSMQSTTDYGKNYGIKAVGKNSSSLYPNEDLTAQRIGLNDVVFERFKYGFYVKGLDDGAWQFSYVKLDHCFFLYNKLAGLYLETGNTEWKITNSVFSSPAFISNLNGGDNADGIRIKKGGTTQIENSFGGGDNYANRGGDFIDVQRAAAVTIINCSTERLVRSLRFGKDGESNGYSYPITLINNIFGDKIEFNSRTIFTSIGNYYSANTFVSITGSNPAFVITPLINNDVRISSFGDRFCYDQGCTLNDEDPPSAPLIRDFYSGQLIFSTSEMNDGSTLASRPATISTDTKIDLNFFQPTTTTSHKFMLSRNSSNGWLEFLGSQTEGTTNLGLYRGFFFNGPMKIVEYTQSQLTSITTATPSTVVFCKDCIENTSPCQGGGTGSLAVYAYNSTWKCN